MKVTFENLNIRSQLSRLPRLAHLRLSVEIMCASGGFIGSIVNNKATLMDQSILDGLPEGYTLAKVGNSTKWILKNLKLDNS